MAMRSHLQLNEGFCSFFFCFLTFSKTSGHSWEIGQPEEQQVVVVDQKAQKAQGEVHLQGALILLMLQSTRQRLVRQVVGHGGGAAAVGRADPLALQQYDANADDYHR